MNRPRSLVALAVVSLMLVTAGCAGVEPTDTRAVGSQTATAVEQRPSTVTATPTATPSDTATPTDTPWGTLKRTLPYDIRVSNYGNATRTVDVTVTYNGTGEQLYDERLTVAPGEHFERNLSFRDPGNYTIQVRVGGETHTYVWRVESTPPDMQVFITVEGDEVYFTRNAV